MKIITKKIYGQSLVYHLRVKYATKIFYNIKTFWWFNFNYDNNYNILVRWFKKNIYTNNIKMFVEKLLNNPRCWETKERYDKVCRHQEYSIDDHRIHFNSLVCTTRQDSHGSLHLCIIRKKIIIWKKLFIDFIVFIYDIGAFKATNSLYKTLLCT